jgi:mono/diheme cytochrome c family protein
MRYVYLVTFFIVVLSVAILGFRGSTSTKPPLEVFPDMDRQEKYKPQARSAFFADGRTDRPLPPGVVARGQLRLEVHLNEGRAANGDFARGYPPEVTIDHTFLARGRERYDIYCAPCHGGLGDGRGIVSAYGWGTPANLHADNFRQMPEGEIFNTITHGKNTMFPYADKLTPEERWAVVAYVRVLQRAQNGRLADVPPARRAELGIQ